MVTAPEGPMEAELLVNELDIPLAEAGQRVELSVDALPGRVFSATVEATSYSPASQTDSAGVVEYPVTVLLDDSVPELLMGMSVEAEIVVAEAVDVLVVPTTAIMERNGKEMVLVPAEADEDDGTAADATDASGGFGKGMAPGGGFVGLKVVWVEVGLWSESLVEIRSGLTEGQVIVAQILSSGASEPGGGLFPGGPGGGMREFREDAGVFDKPYEGSGGLK
jgi:HlyD family secretion protein